jgi:uncharacterized protein
VVVSCDRSQFTEVPRRGPKAFVQTAGFLRIRGDANSREASAVQPGSYPLVEDFLRD